MADTGTWEALRRKTRQLETTIDARLTTYSSLASQIVRSTESSSSSSGIYGDHTTLDMDGSRGRTDDEHVEIATELDTLLNQLSSAVDALTAKLDDPETPPTSAQLHAVQRHREVLFDFTRDFRRSRSNVKHAIDRRDLLGNVHGDINAYKAAHASDADALLAERGHIDNSHAMIDRTLEQAYATRSDFADQRNVLQSVSSRMASTAAQVPGINSLISLIARRRRRDSLILGCLIGTLTVLLLMFTFR